MRYTDVVYGDNKYRGVIFDSYRPYCTGYTSSNNEQSYNGYNTNTVYWFKYEPIKWRVLDPSTGMVMSETILDSQAYNNYIIYIIKNGDEYYGDKQLKYTNADGNEKDWFANNYEKSSIREWLNKDFYNTAFSASQKSKIATTTLDNKAYSTSYSAYDSATTNDKIYLLSYADSLNTSYGFSSSTSSSTTRTAQGSDYAKSQGLYVNSSSENSYWRLRSAGSYSSHACRVGSDGDVYDGYTYSTGYGVRPALNLNLTSVIVQYPITSIEYYQTGDTFEFGWYPQSKVEDTDLIAALNAEAGDNKSWTSYGYYSGTGNTADGNMTASDYMRYTDVFYNGNKYRGVVFDSYRPDYTGYDCSSDNSHQDDNGYSTNTVYWFKYEPIKWRVLDPSTGMVMSETILDSQAYSNYVIESGTDEYDKKAYWGNLEKTYYTNNYEKSSIREWLNKDFYNTAFSASQKSEIATTTLDNSAYSTDYSKYDSATTNDKIYLLSYADALNTSYGFSSSRSDSTTRTAQGSDYAKSQGLCVYSSNENSY